MKPFEANGLLNDCLENGVFLSVWFRSLQLVFSLLLQLSLKISFFFFYL